jgi:SAM-dependent methyltransferase
MLKEHYFDPTFEYASKILKKYLEYKGDNRNMTCLDIPSGNGRNIFLLAFHFKHVYGLDISRKYLDEIENLKAKYEIYNISTICTDIIMDDIEMLSNVNFVCVTHLYNNTLFNKIKQKMKTGAKIYIETPTCRGGNYIELPSKNEIDIFLKGYKVISYKENVCKSDLRFEKGVSFTAILERE